MAVCKILVGAAYLRRCIFALSDGADRDYKYAVWLEKYKNIIAVSFFCFQPAGLNVGETRRVGFAVGLVMFLAMISFALYVSTKMRSTVSSLAVALVFCFLPVLAMRSFRVHWGCGCSAYCRAAESEWETAFCMHSIDFKFLHLGNRSMWIPYALVFFAMFQIPLFFILAVRAHYKMRK